MEKEEEENGNVRERGKGKKESCFVCRNLGHHATQCRHRVKNNNSPKPKTNFAKGHGVIAAFVFKVNIVINVNKWVVDS